MLRGIGTKNNPYLVSNAKELNEVRKNMGAYYRQIDNIDLSGWGNWEPIGSIEGSPQNSPSFTGEYDGQNYIIENMNSQVFGDYTYAGLFSVIDNANLKNIRILNGFARADYLSGLLTSVISNSLVSNCNVEGTTKAATSGLFAAVIADKDGSVERCSAKGNIEGWETGGHAGGFVVYNSGQIKNCSFIGNIKGQEGDYFFTGGLVETNHAEGNIINCYTVANIEYDKDIPYYSIGGIARRNEGEIESSYFDFNKFKTNIAEWEEGRRYNRNVIIKGTDGNIYKCYDTQPSNDWDDFPNYPPFYQGRPVDGTEWEDYWELYHPVKARTTTEMKTKSTYVGWDFENVWDISEEVNEGYPILRDQVLREPYPLYFLETPEVKYRPIQANSVTVKSPASSFTAEVDNLSTDEKIERIVEIEEGSQETCRLVAEQLLSKWSREQRSVIGLINLNQDLSFKKKVNIVCPEAMIEEDMTIQKQEHDIVNYTTTVTCGDIILDDAELLARILDDLGVE